MSDNFIPNKTVLITGSTDGIGKQTALELARLGAQVWLHGRDANKAQAAQAEIGSKSGNPPAGFFVADLSSQAEVRRLAAEVLERLPQLHVLLHNAGVNPKERILTVDGLELTFAVNHLAPFLLTQLLLERLRQSAPARILSVNSVGHLRTPAINWDNLQGEQVYKSWHVYCLSKLGNMLFTVEQAARLAGSGVTVNALHPGVIDTKLLREGLGIPGAPVEEGARTSVYLATAPEVAAISGKYFDACQVVAHSPLADDAELRRRFWDVSARLTGLQ